MTDSSTPLPKGIKLTPFDPTYKADPYAILKDVRERAPIFEDDQFKRWYVSRYEDVRAVLRDKDMSSDPYKANPNSYMARIAAVAGVPRQETAKASMIFLDDPDHRRLRGLVNKAFTPKAVEQLRPRIREIAEGLLAEIRTPEFDLMASFAGPFPVIVIAEMLGIDPGDRGDFKRWSDVAVSTFFNPFRTPEQSAVGMEAQYALNRYFQRMIDLRRAAPREDLITAMLRAEESGDHMTDDEVIMQCNLLLVAGNVTTTDLIGNGMKSLLEHPKELAKLRARPELIPNTVEEILRFDSPVTNAGRNVQREMSMRGCPFQVGDSVTVSLAAANHDPSVNPDPERFDIERQNIQHQSFGGGKHLCLGAPLARVEARVGIAALLARFPELRASPRGFQYRAIPSFRGLSEYWLQS